MTLASEHQRVWGVAQLLRRVRSAIARDFGGPIVVRGELANVKTPPNGYVYFTIKEPTAALNCYVSAVQARGMTIPPPGAKVDVEGSLGFYDAGGVFQLTVSRIEVVGDGAQAARLEKLKIKLRAAGYFERERKRPLPLYPMHVALVTSPGSDAEKDFRKELRERAPFVRVRLVPTPVQGPFAPESIAHAIRSAGRLRCDVIVVARGGGSEEDRMAFNEEAVAVAIFESPVPVLTAIGHQADHHIADDVADHSSDTPNDAATDLTVRAYRVFADLAASRSAMLSAMQRRTQESARLVRDLRARLTAETVRTIDQRSQQLDESKIRLPAAARHALTQKAARLHGVTRRLDARSPAAQLAGRAARLEAHRQSMLRALRRAGAASAQRLGERRRDLERSTRAAQLRKGRELALLSAKLDGINPEAILQRGYAIVRVDGRAVHDAASLSRGEVIEAKLARGSLSARVEEIQPDD